MKRTVHCIMTLPKGLSDHDEIGRQVVPFSVEVRIPLPPQTTTHGFCECTGCAESIPRLEGRLIRLWWQLLSLVHSKYYVSNPSWCDESTHMIECSIRCTEKCLAAGRKSKIYCLCSMLTDRYAKRNTVSYHKASYKLWSPKAVDHLWEQRGRVSWSDYQSSLV